MSLNLLIQNFDMRFAYRIFPPITIIQNPALRWCCELRLDVSERGALAVDDIRPYFATISGRTKVVEITVSYLEYFDEMNEDLLVRFDSIID